MPAHIGLMNDARAVLAAVRAENQRNNTQTSWFFPSEAQVAIERLVKALQNPVSSNQVVWAAKDLLNGHYEKLKVHHGLNISLTNGVQLPSLYNGYSSLHWAVIDDNEDEFKFDINNQNIFAHDNLGRTALHLAVTEGNLTKFLNHIPELKKKGLLATRDHTGKTLLHLIAEQQYFQVLEVVPELTQNRLPFIKDLTGKTALHLAAERGQFQEFLQLIPENEQNELATITDNSGRTAYDYAAEWERNHPEEENDMENRF